MRLSIWAGALTALVLSGAPALAQTAPKAPPPPAAPAVPATPAAPPAGPRTWARYAATEVTLKDLAAIVYVRPESRPDIAYALVRAGALEAPQLRSSRGGGLTVDGGLRRQIRSCSTRANGFRVQLARQGWINEDDLPVIELRVPQRAVVTAGGAVRLHVARAQSARVRVDGCGDADLEGVDDDADIVLAGSPDLRLYDAGTATIRVAGAGDVVIGAVRSGLTVSIAGAGDVTAARADGPTNIAIQGAGDVTIRDGRAGALSVVIAGAGDVTHNGTAASLDAAVFGVGDVRVRRVTGEVTRRVLGAGDVTVGR